MPACRPPTAELETLETSLFLLCKLEFPLLFHLFPCNLGVATVKNKAVFCFLCFLSIMAAHTPPPPAPRPKHPPFLVRRATVGGREGLHGTLLPFSSDINEIELHKGSKNVVKIRKNKQTNKKRAFMNRKKTFWMASKFKPAPLPDHPAPKCIQTVFLAFPLRFSGTYQAVLKMNGPSSLPSSFFPHPPPPLWVVSYPNTNRNTHSPLSGDLFTHFNLARQPCV